MISKALTIVFADIQGYTSRTSRFTREENQNFIKELSRIIYHQAETHQGRVVKTMGDGFLLAFESPTNAVTCGLDLQLAIEKRNSNILDRDNFVKFRIGICTGEVEIDEKGDVFGDAVNIAARIERFADPNNVFISESTYLAMNKAEVNAMDLGPQQFKNVLSEIRVYKVLQGEPSLIRKSVPLSRFKHHLSWVLGGSAVLMVFVLFGIWYVNQSLKATRINPLPLAYWEDADQMQNELFDLWGQIQNLRNIDHHLMSPRLAQLMPSITEDLQDDLFSILQDYYSLEILHENLLTDSSQ